MYGCESWTVKKFECRRIDAFVVLEKTLESLLDCKEIQPTQPKGDQSWVFIGRTDVEAETPVLWPPDAKSWLIWKDPDLGKIEGRRRRGRQRMRLLVGIIYSIDMGLDGLQQLVMNREAWCAAVHGVKKSWTWLSDWTKLNWSPSAECLFSFRCVFSSSEQSRWFFNCIKSIWLLMFGYSLMFGYYVRRLGLL